MSEATATTSPKPQRRGTFTSDTRPINVNRSRLILRDAYELEQLIMTRIREPEIDNKSLAYLARAFVSVSVDCIRVLRGIPSPGQFRPVATAAQLAQMLKKARKATFIDMEALPEAGEPEPEATTNTEDSKGIS